MLQKKPNQDRIPRKRNRKTGSPSFETKTLFITVVILKRTYRKWRFRRPRRPTKIKVVTANDDPMAMANEDVCSKTTFSSLVSAVKQQNTVFCDGVSHFLRAFT